VRIIAGSICASYRCALTTLILLINITERLRLIHCLDSIIYKFLFFFVAQRHKTPRSWIQQSTDRMTSLVKGSRLSTLLRMSFFSDFSSSQSCTLALQVSIISDLCANNIREMSDREVIRLLTRSVIPAKDCRNYEVLGELPTLVDNINFQI